MRAVALDGYDGTGHMPIPFGQYMLGYKTGSRPPDTGPYVVTESQINVVSFATWTMGGKWMNFFRWERDPRTYLLYDGQEDRTPQYYQYAKLAWEGRNLGPYLVRLTSTDVRLLPGQHRRPDGQTEPNRRPDGGPAWDGKADPYLTAITVQNLGEENDGLPGDVLIGFFRPLPDIEPDFFPSPDVRAFMVLNGLTSGNGLLPPEQHGSADETAQWITLYFDLGERSPDTLRRVSRSSGQVEEVKLEPAPGGLYQLDLVLGGGLADLFFWQ